ncbi:MAG: autotransporter-associated beta strand repeat-containing protein [Chthoniobacterales bacterium]
MNANLTTSKSGALARLTRPVFSAALLPALLLLCAVRPSQAGSATWKVSPANGDWNTANHWTPQTVPNGPSDTATFATSSKTAISLSDVVEVNGVAFNSGASAFTITVPFGLTLTLSGVGITNNSGITQNFVTTEDNFSSIIFSNSASAGSATSFTTASGGGGIFFNDTSTASTGVFTVNGPGQLFFNGTATAGSGTFTINSSESFRGSLFFNDSSTAGTGVFTLNGNGIAAECYFQGASTSAANSLFTINGADSANHGNGFVLFNAGATAAGATLIANSGLNGGSGGQIFFVDTSTGGTARVEVFGDGTGDSTNGLLDISQRPAPGVTIGSVEGNGLVNLGNNNLTVGSNNLSTTFSGIIKEGGIASLAKTGKGKFTLSNANTYSGGTTVTKGTLLVKNKTGSATGTGAVQVNAGTLGGTGKISGAVTVGTTTAAGILAPGTGSKPGTLTLLSTLTFNSSATFQVDFNSTKVKTDKVSAKGVTINSGAQFSFTDHGAGTPPIGAIFTLINDTAGTPIAGTFANLPDGSTFTEKGNNYQASYEGGTGNDLTLTVVPPPAN